jgi:hypothetical protein
MLLDRRTFTGRIFPRESGHGKARDRPSRILA